MALSASRGPAGSCRGMATGRAAEVWLVTVPSSSILPAMQNWKMQVLFVFWVERRKHNGEDRWWLLPKGLIPQCHLHTGENAVSHSSLNSLGASLKGPRFCPICKPKLANCGFMDICRRLWRTTWVPLVEQRAMTFTLAKLALSPCPDMCRAG